MQHEVALIPLQSTRQTCSWSCAMRRLQPILAHIAAGREADAHDGSTAAVVETEATSVADLADSHLIQPYDLLDTKNTTMVQAGGRGIYLITDSGEEIIDGPGGMWNVQVGYGRREIAEAIGNQALAMAYNSPWHNTSGPAARLASEIAKRAPAGLNRVFFTTGAHREAAGGLPPPRIF